METSKYNHTLCKVKENNKLAKDIYKLVIEGSFKGNPGEFYMLKCWEEEPVLYRPISIHSIDENKIEFVYAAIGKGTKLISKLDAGNEVKLIGPLGNGFPIEEIKGKVAIVTGGIGIAPMEYVIKNLKDCTVDLFIGFREEAYCIEELKPLVNSINLATEYGEIGHRGYVTEIFDPKGYDVVLCCGPEVMMDKVLKMCKETNTKIFISEEKKMACGIGACLVCTCKTINGNKKTCKDGPVFRGEELEAKGEVRC